MKRKTAVLPTTTHFFVANGKVTVKVTAILLESAEQVLYYTHKLQTAQQIAEQVALHTQRAANPASHCLRNSARTLLKCVSALVLAALDSLGTLAVAGATKIDAVAGGVLWSAGGVLVECQWQSQPVLQQAVRLSPCLRSRAPFLHSCL